MNKEGLFEKYIVSKANGEPIDPEAKYFVLRYDKASADFYAWKALLTYAIRSSNQELHDALKKEKLDREE